MKVLEDGTFFKFYLYGKTGLIFKPDTIIINHQLELSGTRVKYLDHVKRAFKHEFVLSHIRKNLLYSLVLACPEKLDV